MRSLTLDLGIWLRWRFKPAICRDLGIHLVTMIIIIGQGIINGGKAHLRIITEEFFRINSVMQHIHNDGTDGNPCSYYTRTTSTRIWITEDMGMKDFWHILNST